MTLVCSPSNTDPTKCVELTDREYSVCKVICTSEAPVSFTELKNSTQLHQEIVSRIVKRLVVHGLTTKTQDGRYRKAFS